MRMRARQQPCLSRVGIREGNELHSDKPGDVAQYGGAPTRSGGSRHGSAPRPAGRPLPCNPQPCHAITPTLPVSCRPSLGQLHRRPLAAGFASGKRLADGCQRLADTPSPTCSALLHVPGSLRHSNFWMVVYIAPLRSRGGGGA